MTDTSNLIDCVLNEPITENKVSCFEPVTVDKVLKIISGSPIKSCALHPIPAKLLCNILPILAPVYHGYCQPLHDIMLISTTSQGGDDNTYPEKTTA